MSKLWNNIERTGRRKCSIAATVAASLLLALGGCAAVDPAARFPAVEQAVKERLDRRIIWDRGGTEARAVGEQTTALLAHPLTADDAVQVALLNSNGLQATFEDLGVAQLDLIQAGLLPNPSFGGFLRGTIGGGSAGPSWNIGADAFGLDIFLLPLRKRLAGAALDEAEQRVTGVVLKLAADTRTAYYALQAEQQVFQGQQRLEEIAKLTADYAQRQYEAGNIDDLTLAREQVAAAQASIIVARAETVGVAEARERLHRLMGLSVSQTTWTVIADAAQPPAAQFDEERLVEFALASRADIAANRNDIRRLEYALELTRKWWLDTIRVGGEVERSTSGLYQAGPHLSVDIPLFDRKQAAIPRQEALIRQAYRRGADIEQQVRLEVRTSLSRMRGARRVEEHYRIDLLPLSTRISEMLEKRYQGMILGVFDVFVAKKEEVTIQSAGARARQEYWTARSDLELAIGRRLLADPTTEPTTLPNDKQKLPMIPNEPSKEMPRIPGMNKPATAPSVTPMPDMPEMR